MQSWLANKLISLRDGTHPRRRHPPDAAARRPRRAAHLSGATPGRAVYRGKQEVERWLRRLAAVGIQTFPDEVVAKGMPWNTTICVRGHDHLDAPDGSRVYENRFVIWGRLSWGRLKDYEVYEDTAQPHDLDAYLAEQRPELAAA